MKLRPSCGLAVLCVVGHCVPALAQTPNKDSQPPAKAPAKPAADYPVIDIEHKAAASEVMVLATKFVTESKCGACRGDGSTIEETLKYPTNTKSPLVEPSKSRKKVKCDKCAGTGLARGPGFQRVADDLVTKFAHLNPADSKADTARQKVLESLQKALKDNSRAANEIFSVEFKRRTEGEPIKTGTPIIMIGHLMEDPSSGGGVGDAKLLRIGMVAGKRYLPEEMNAFVSDASIRKAGKGDVVVVGGIFAGRQRINDRESAPVLQGGFVMSLE